MTDQQQLYTVKSAVVKVSVGGATGHRVAQILRRGDIIPAGIEQERLDQLEKRGLIEKVQTEPDGPRKPGGNAGADKWKAYAEQIGVQVPTEAEKDRDAIKALIEAHEAATATK